MKQGQEIPDKYDMSSLRVLGSVGEPINPEAYVWYRHVIGGDRTPVVDTWWQTETGAIMISPLPGVTAGKPGSAMIPIPGVSADVVTEEGESVPNGSGGYLVLTEPWPSMLRTIWGDDDRFKETYWSKYEKQGWYFAGDGAKKDERRRPVGARPGRRRHERLRPPALHHRDRVRAGLAPEGGRGRGGRRRRTRTPARPSCAFVILRERAPATAASDIVDELRKHVRKEIGPIATPRQIMIVAELPKTRSGKIMRRLLRDVAENREVGDVTTLADSSVMDLIKDKEVRQAPRTAAARSRRQHEVAQRDVGDAEADRDGGDDQSVAGERPEADRVPVALGDADDDDVGAGADGGGVAAEVGAQRERPPQVLLRVVGRGRGRRGRRRAGPWWRRTGCCRRSPDRTAEPTSMPESGGCVVVADRGGEASARSPITPVDQGADHDEQAGEEEQGLPLDLLEVDRGAATRETRIGRPAPSRATSDGSRWVTAWVTKPTRTRASTTPPHAAAAVGDRLAASSRITASARSGSSAGDGPTAASTARRRPPAAPRRWAPGGPGSR